MEGTAVCRDEQSIFRYGSFFYGMQMHIEGLFRKVQQDSLGIRRLGIFRGNDAGVAFFQEVRCGQTLTGLPVKEKGLICNLESSCAGSCGDAGGNRHTAGCAVQYDFCNTAFCRSLA